MAPNPNKQRGNFSRPLKTYPPAKRGPGKVTSRSSILKSSVKRNGTPKKKVRFSVPLATYAFKGFTTQDVNKFVNYAKLRCESIKAIVEKAVRKTQVRRSSGMSNNKTQNSVSVNTDLETRKMQCKECFRVAYFQDRHDKMERFSSFFLCRDCFEKPTNLSITRHTGPNNAFIGTSPTTATAYCKDTIKNTAHHTTSHPQQYSCEHDTSNPKMEDESPEKELVVTNVRSLANVPEFCNRNNKHIEKLAGQKMSSTSTAPTESESTTRVTDTSSNGIFANDDSVISPIGAKQVTVRTAEGSFTFVVGSDSDGNNIMKLLFSGADGTPDDPIIIDDDN